MTLRKGVFSSLVMTSLALVPFAAAHAELKIGVVDMRRVLQEAPQTKAVSQQLQEEFSPRQRELVQMQTTLKAKQEKLQKDGAVMSDAERTRADRELRDGEREFQRKQNELQEDANVRQNEEMGKLQRSMLSEVDSVGKTGGYDLILLSDAVLFKKDAIDVTGQVLSALQQRAKAAPAAPAPKPAPKPATKP